METLVRPFRLLPRFLLALAAGLFAFASGGAAYLALGGPRAVARPGAAVALWVSDRGADALLGLDADLLPRRRVELRAPTELEPATGGGVWVASATEGWALGAHELWRVRPDASAGARLRLGPILDLAAREGGVLVVELQAPPGAERLLSVDDDGRATVLAELEGLACAAAGGTQVLAGSRHGELWMLSLGRPGPPLALGWIGGEVTDVAPGPRPGSFWVLEAGGARRLMLLEPDLEPRWEVATGLAGLHLIPVPGEERVWLADATQPFARRYGPGGVLEIERDRLPLGDLDRGLPWREGGVLIVAPGALLHLDAAGRLAPGQGGFQFLVDLAPAAR